MPYFYILNSNIFSIAFFFACMLYFKYNFFLLSFILNKKIKRDIIKILELVQNIKRKVENDIEV